MLEQKKEKPVKKNKYKGVTTAVKFLRSKNINDNKYYQDYDKEKRQKNKRNEKSRKFINYFKKVK